MDEGRLFFDHSCSGNMLILGKGDLVFSGSRSLLNMEETSKRRPFFLSSPDELIEEEFYDEQIPEKKRRLTPEQFHLLEKSFEEENKLEPERKTQLAQNLGLKPRQVAVWFQNRRTRWKTKQLERGYDLLKASYDSLRSDYDFIVKENEKLKSEVASLTEKLHAKEMAGMGMMGQKSDPLLVADNAVIQFCVKAEDRLSSGSGGSAIVDDRLQLMDCGDSYLANEDYGQCVGPINGVQSEEDDGSNDNRSYNFSDIFVAADNHGQHHEETETLGWWVWS